MYFPGQATEVYAEPSKIERLEKIFDGFQTITIFTKHSILDV